MKNSVKVALIALLVLVAFVAVGCTKEKPKATVQAPAPATTPVAAPAPAPVQKSYVDGDIYFAADDEYADSGWKETVTLVVSGDKIVDVDWNGVNIAGGVDKKTYDRAGKYNMVKFGQAQAEWSVQAERAEQYLLETQDPKGVTYKDAEGATDDIAGVSIHVKEFFSLVEKALAQGPVGRGPYADGAYYASADTFDDAGWKEFVSFTVLNGRIAGINWSGVNQAGDDKKAYDKAGNYNMVKFGQAQAEWYEQAKRAEDHLVETQDVKAIKIDNEGYTDDIAGVSIHVSGMYSLVEKALAAGPQN